MACDRPCPLVSRTISRAVAFSAITARTVAYIGDENARLRSRFPRTERSAPCRCGDVSNRVHRFKTVSRSSSTANGRRLKACRKTATSTNCAKSHRARERAVETVTADRFAANVLPIIREAQKAGATTLREIAAVLNARGIATARGGQWHAKSISNVLERA